MVDCTIFDVNNMRFGNTSFYSIFAFAIRFSITVLFGIGCPFEIAFFIMSIIVNTIQSIFRGRLTSNFCQKFFIRIKEKFDTSAAISIITSHFRIIATRFRVSIGSIFSRSRIVFTVNNVSRFGLFNCPTSARTRFMASQIDSTDNTISTASTSTQPENISVMSGIDTDNKPTVKCLPRQDCGIRTKMSRWIKGYVKIQVRHFGLQYRFMCLGLGELFQQSPKLFLFYHRSYLYV